MFTHGILALGIGHLGEWTSHNLIIETCNITSPNHLCTLANGRRVLALPIWFYCDDTLGNVSKKWNKHNSLLFTFAGLPQEYAEVLYNIHFLAMSNIAAPLEMFDAVVDVLR